MRRRIFTIAAVAILIVALLAATPVYAGKGSPPGTWYPLSPLPGGGVEGAAVGGVGNTLIVAYGNELGLGDTTTTRLYDIDSDTWSLGAPAPGSPRAEPAYGELTHGGKLYVIGGRSIVTGVLNNLECYDVAADTWTTLTPMPTPRSAAAAAIVGNAIYVIGGRTTGGGPGSGMELAVVERYNIAKDTWTKVAPLPRPLSDMAVVSHGGKIYIFGGYSSFGADDDGDGLINEDPWEGQVDNDGDGLYNEDPPNGIDDDGDTLIDEDGWDPQVDNDGDGKVGEDPPPGHHAVGSIFVYNQAKDKWSALGAMMPRASLMAGKVGNNAYLIGGISPVWVNPSNPNGLTPMNTVYNITKGSISFNTPMPGPLPGRAVGETGAYSHGGRVYIPGGGQPACGTGANYNQMFKP